MRENEILEKNIVGEKIKSFKIYSSEIPKKASPGQFIVLRLSEKGERFPLTLCDWNKDEGWIKIIFQEIGKSTIKLGEMEEGMVIMNILGPLGKPSEIRRFGKVVFVAGGVGTAEIYPVVKGMKEAGNIIKCIIGFRSSKQVILEKELGKIADEIIVTTEDGSKGKKGFVTDALNEILDEEKIDLVYSVGPLIMMKVVGELTRKFNVPTRVSLNPIMVDGTGICGSCRVEVDGKIKFACIDGPEFDAHKVNFEELMTRNRRFVKEEKVSLDRYLKAKD